MRLSELIEPSAAPRHAADIEILGIAWDSRDVEPGFLFAALDGTRARGVAFIPDALAHGAVAVLVPEGTDPGLVQGAAHVVEDANPRRRLALMAARFYGAQPKVVAAVTGTNGKTSVAEFTRQLWTSAGYNAGTLGSLGAQADGIHHPLRHTTPDPVTLHRTVAELVAHGVDHLVLEASSHGLAQYRIDGLRLDAAAFTNLTRDHMDYHPDAESYYAAKARLFEEVLVEGGTAVLNADAPESTALAALSRSRGNTVLTFGEAAADLRLIARRDTPRGQDLDLEILGAPRQVSLHLPGGFQAHNALAAVGLVIATGVDVDDALAALPRLRGVRGRLELAARHPSGAPVYVDYAHTPDALTAALHAVRPLATGRVVVVFGCGGERDRGKRGQMGAVATRLADRVIVTDDNPRGEDPAAIRRDILASCGGAVEIGDRGAAIGAAVEALAPGDVLLIAGKGHEQGQTIGDRVIAFDDASVARDAVAALAPEKRGLGA